MIKTIDNPTKTQISEIEHWLNEEWKSHREGFITDWEMIPEAYEENRLLVFLKNELPVGFLVFRKYGRLGHFDIAEIKPSERKNGFGLTFIQSCIEYLKRKDVWIVQLFCSPKNSKGFWGKCGFTKYELPADSKINMFMPLFDVLRPNDSQINDNYIKLWS